MLTDSYDVIVIGAGPAGALAALDLGSRGLSVLLVEKAEFPRYKVCGCCLSAASLQVLERYGLASFITSQGDNKPLTEIELYFEQSQLVLPLPPGKAIARSTFDNLLAQTAVANGVTFRQRTQALVGDLCAGNSARQVQLTDESGPHSLRAAVVIVADGLSGTATSQVKELNDNRENREKVIPSSRIGAGTHLEPDLQFESGKIYMACAAGGYVGAVVLEDGALDVAAAFDRRFVQEMGGPAFAAATILKQAGMPEPREMETTKWRGTGQLTRRRQHIACRRLFVIGDSGSYVEPFTGEGMAWALSSAALVAPLAARGVKCWSDELAQEWEQLYARLIRRRQLFCAGTAAVLKSPLAMRTCKTLLAHVPYLAQPIVHHLNKPLL